MERNQPKPNPSPLTGEGPVLTPGESSCVAQGINIVLLRQVAERIKAHPKAFDMATYFYQSTAPGNISIDEAGPALPDILSTECGTTACIAGWTVALAKDEYMPHIGNTRRRAIKALGLAGNQASNLFGEDWWPEPFCDEYEKAVDAENRQAMADIAVRRIEHFIQSGGAE